MSWRLGLTFFVIEAMTIEAKAIFHYLRQISFFSFVNRYRKVPDVIFATIEPPVESPIVGRGCLLQARYSV